MQPNTGRDGVPPGRKELCMKQPVRIVALLLCAVLLCTGCAATGDLPVIETPQPVSAAPPAAKQEPASTPVVQTSANDAVENTDIPDPEKEPPAEPPPHQPPPTILETQPPAEPEPAPVVTPPAAPTPAPAAADPATDPATTPVTEPDPAVDPPAPPPDVDPRYTLAAQVDADRLYGHLYTLCKEIGARRVGTDGNANARQYILNQLTALGFSEADGSLWKQGFYSTGNLYTENIVASIPSAGGTGILLLSSHLDSVRDTEGAVDNASGVAALLECARLIKQSGLQYNFEIRFCFFSAEEDGYKGASEYIARQGSTELSRHIVYNIDMAGYADDGTPKALVVSTKGDPSISDWNAAQPNAISGSIVKAYYHLDMNYRRFYSPTNAGKHDIVPFYARGIPCATLSLREIDFTRAYGNDLGIAAPWLIHTPDDRLEKLNLESVSDVTKITVCAVAYLSDQSV